MDTTATGITFENRITETPQLNVLTFPYLYNGGGVGIGDVNGDGLKDIFFAGNMVSSRLFLNRGNWHFEDVTEAAGLATKRWCTGVAMVDINGDGLLDLYVCTIDPVYGKSSPNLFFINQGTDSHGIPHYKDMAVPMGLADTGFSTQAAFLDYDGDGDLDMYLLTNGNVQYNRNEVRKIVTDGSDPSTGRLYRNDGIPPGGTVPVFTNVSRQAGILQQGWGLGVVVCDVNKDNWPDIYVANDFLSNDQLLINNHDGTFTNSIAGEMRHQSQNSMGTDAADVNNDGWPDIVTVDMKPFDNARDKSMFARQNYDRFQLQLKLGYQPEFVRNSLQLNNGDNSFSEIGQLAGIYATDWSWSALFADFDNDGYKDLFISNGYGKDVTDLDYLSYMGNGVNNLFGNDAAKQKRAYEQMNRLKDVSLQSFLFHNNQDLTFTNMAVPWGLDQPSLANGAAYADLDNDGDLDLVVNNINQGASVYRNNLMEQERASDNHATHHRYLQIRLEGSSMNRQALGSKAELFAQGTMQYAELTLQRGFMSSVDNTLYFGVDTLQFIDSLRITWPDRKTTVCRNIRTDQVLQLAEKDASKPAGGIPPAEPLFQQLSHSGIAYKHINNDYVDFRAEPLMPYQYSRCGPAIAAGDIDGDGLDDLFIGGAAGRPNHFFLQQKDGSFRERVFEQNKPYEDMGALLFDADNDGDVDLYVVSGGNEFPSGSPLYQDRLYRNDGKGNFRLDTTALPLTKGSGSTIIAADFDGDGDLDLFVAGKADPHHYPLPGRSYLLRNDGGKFTDVTTQLAPAIASAGIINSAIFTDFDNDGQIDLIVAGEWMPVTFLQNRHGHFTDVTASTGIGDRSGWYNSIIAADFNNDGHMDYIVGNMGLNTRYKASVQQPLRIYARDLNNDGSIDPIMTYYLNGREVTDAYRDDFIKQITGGRRRFPSYADFGVASMDEILTPGEREGAYIEHANWMYSSFIENKGHGKFSITPLPNLAQAAPVYGLLAGDFNGDGNLDLLMTGNQYNSNTTVGQYDAFNGLVLQGNGKGEWQPLTTAKAGFVNRQDGKAMAEVLTGANGTIVVVTNNNDSVKVFRNHKANDVVLKLLAMDSYALIHHQSGAVTKMEVSYGSGYLSQSSRILHWPADALFAEVVNYQGQKRIEKKPLKQD